MSKQSQQPDRAFLKPGERQPIYVTIGQPDRALMIYFMTPRTAAEALPVMAASLLPDKPKRSDRKQADKDAKKLLKRLVKDHVILEVRRFLVSGTVKSFKHMQVQPLAFEEKHTPEGDRGLVAVGKPGDPKIIARLNRDLLHAVQSKAKYDLPRLIRIASKNRHLTGMEAANRLLGDLPGLLAHQMVYLAPVKK